MTHRCRASTFARSTRRYDWPTTLSSRARETAPTYVPSLAGECERLVVDESELYAIQEDTSDEAYMARHAFAEADERRRFALPQKSTRRRSRVTHDGDGTHEGAGGTGGGDSTEEDEDIETMVHAAAAAAATSTTTTSSSASKGTETPQTKRPRARRRRFTPLKRHRAQAHLESDDGEDELHSSSSSTATAEMPKATTVRRTPGTPRIRVTTTDSPSNKTPPAKRHRGGQESAYPDTFFVTTRSNGHHTPSDSDSDEHHTPLSASTSRLPSRLLASSTNSLFASPGGARARREGSGSNNNNNNSSSGAAAANADRRPWDDYFEYELIARPPPIDPVTNQPKNVLYLRKVLVTL